MSTKKTNKENYQQYTFLRRTTQRIYGLLISIQGVDCTVPMSIAYDIQNAKELVGELFNELSTLEFLCDEPKE